MDISINLITERERENKVLLGKEVTVTHFGQERAWLVFCGVHTDFVCLSLNVNLMDQFGWAVVLRYLVKHYSRFYHKYIFQKKLAFKSVDFEESRLVSIMWDKV